MNWPAFILFSFISLVFCFRITAQNLEDPVFSSFSGKMFKIPAVKKKTEHGFKWGIEEYYGDFIHDYEVIDEVEFDELKILEQDSRDGFPGYEIHKTQIGFYLHAQVEIKNLACYEFSLNSDDGSILWIAGEEIVNNDGSHGMKMKKDSVVLKPGTYDSQVWYFQGYPSKMGLLFDSKVVGPPSTCPSESATTPLESIVLQSQHFFEVDEFVLKPEAEKELQQVILEFGSKKPKSITVIGHTDSTGSPKYNQELSFRRATSLVELLRKQEFFSETKFMSIGKGSTAPIAENNTANGRQMNRRVELIVEF